MIPAELRKPIDEIKAPGTKILIICLVSSIVFMTGLLVWKWKGDGSNCSTSIAAGEKEIKRLNQFIIDHQAEDNERLRKKEKYNDSVLQLTKKLAK